MSFPSPASDNFEQWLEAYLVGHDRIYVDGITCEFTRDDMFSAWVGGAIFAANKMFNPTRPDVPPLPDIFQRLHEVHGCGTVCWCGYDDRDHHVRAYHNDDPPDEQ